MNPTLREMKVSVQYPPGRPRDKGKATIYNCYLTDESIKELLDWIDGVIDVGIFIDPHKTRKQLIDNYRAELRKQFGIKS
jgi:hypothetical protein